MSEVKLPPGPRFAAWESFKLMREPYGYYERMEARGTGAGGAGVARGRGAA